MAASHQAESTHPTSVAQQDSFQMPGLQNCEVVNVGFLKPQECGHLWQKQQEEAERPRPLTLPRGAGCLSEPHSMTSHGSVSLPTPASVRLSG